MGSAARKHYSKMARTAELERRCIVAGNDSERRQLDRLVRRGHVVRPHARIYARRSYWETLKPDAQALHKIRALALLHPNWTFSHASAALIHGLDVPYRELAVLHVSAGRGSWTRSTAAIRRHETTDAGFEVVGGVRVTTLERTVFDCLRTLGFGRALAVADSYLRVRGCSKGALARTVIGFGDEGCRGVERALACVAHADARAESGGESIARATMIELGYLMPELQAKVADPLEAGRFWRVDYLWKLPDGRRVAGELDGREKYVSPEMTGGRAALDVLADERLRESRISASGIQVMRFSWRDLADARRFSSIMDAYGIPRASMPDCGAHRPALVSAGESEIVAVMQYARRAA